MSTSITHLNFVSAVIALYFLQVTPPMVAALYPGVGRQQVTAFVNELPAGLLTDENGSFELR